MAVATLRCPSRAVTHVSGRHNPSWLWATITFKQWLLALMALGVATAALSSQSVTSTAIVVVIISAISLILTVLATYNTLRSGLLGQGAMMSALWIMFFMEAIKSALGDLPFSAPDYFNYGAVQFDVEVIHRSMLHLCLFQLMLLVGFVIPIDTWRFGCWFARRVDIERGRLILEVLLVVFIPLSLGSTYLWNWNHLFRSMLGSYNSRLGEDSALLVNPPFLYYLFPIGLYGASVLFVEALESRGIRRYTAGTIAAIAIFVVVLTGSRHMVLVILLPISAIVLRRSFMRLRLPRVLLWAFAVLVLFCVFQLQVVTREVGWGATRRLDPDQLAKAEITGQFPALLVSESLVPARHDFFLEPTPIYFVTHWIPRRFWPDKPVEKVWQYFNDEVTGGNPVWNVAPSVIGQFYMNCGVIGLCAIGCFLGMLGRITDNAFARLTLQNHRAGAVCVATLYVFIINSFRYFAPFYFVYSVLAFVGMIILTKATRSRTYVI